MLVFRNLLETPVYNIAFLNNINHFIFLEINVYLNQFKQNYLKIIKLIFRDYVCELFSSSVSSF